MSNAFNIKNILYSYRVENEDSLTSQKVSIKKVLGNKSVLRRLQKLLIEHKGKKITTFFKRRVFFYLSELYHATKLVDEKVEAYNIYIDVKSGFTFTGFEEAMINVEEEYIEKIYVLKESKKDHLLLNLKRKLAKFYIRSIMHSC